MNLICNITCRRVKVKPKNDESKPDPVNAVDQTPNTPIELRADEKTVVDENLCNGSRLSQLELDLQLKSQKRWQAR